MSDDTFWFDQKKTEAGMAANGDPELVIKALDGNFHSKGQTRSSLHQMATNGHLELAEDFALFMRGTTSELLRVLSNDLSMGLRYVAIVGVFDQLEIRFVRQRVFGRSGFKKASIFGIAADTYWKRVPVAQTPESASKQNPKAWAGVASVRSIPFRDGKWSAGINQRELIKYLEKGQDVATWF